MKSNDGYMNKSRGNKDKEKMDMLKMTLWRIKCLTQDFRIVWLIFNGFLQYRCLLEVLFFNLSMDLNNIISLT